MKSKRSLILITIRVFYPNQFVETYEDIEDYMDEFTPNTPFTFRDREGREHTLSNIPFEVIRE